jgi:hypothetical protein
MSYLTELITRPADENRQSGANRYELTGPYPVCRFSEPRKNLALLLEACGWAVSDGATLAVVGAAAMQPKFVDSLPEGVRLLGCVKDEIYQSCIPGRRRLFIFYL